MYSSLIYSSFELSNDVAVKNVFQAPICDLKIENVEGRYLLSGGLNSAIHIFDLESTDDDLQVYNLRPRINDGEGSKKQIRPIASVNKSQGHKFGVSGINWFPTDTGLFTSSSVDGTIKVWNTNTLQSAFTFNLENKVHAHAISPISTTHSLIAAASDDSAVRLCDLRSGAFTHSLRGHTSATFCVKWSPINEYLLASGGADCTGRIWDIRRAQSCLNMLDQHNSVSESVPTGITPEKNKAKKRKVWANERTTQNPAPRTTYAHDGPVNSLMFTSDGKFLITSGHDQKIRLWNVNSGKNSLTNYGPYLLNKFSQSIYPEITNLDLCDVPLIYFPSDCRKILIYELWSGRLVKKLTGHFGKVCSVVLRPFHEELYSSATDSEILVWKPSGILGDENKRESEPMEDNWSDDEG
ncbi:DNA excision repair protein ERCC-8 [Nowakowskiella sp. JEL0407]|nr:DNA excision repair protein ERCC-8 [Nowakowskiella sp. JEL0407]